jgi:hypothetical protein
MEMDGTEVLCLLMALLLVLLIMVVM